MLNLTEINLMQKNIIDIIEWIENNIKERITLIDVEDRSGFTKSYFQRVFSEHTGITIAKYIRRRKLSLAAWELISTCKTIGHVCAEYNIGTIQSFSRSFKDEFGVTPNDYRGKFIANFAKHQKRLHHPFSDCKYTIKKIDLKGSSVFKKPRNAIIDSHGYPIMEHLNSIKKSAVLGDGKDSYWVIEFKSRQKISSVYAHPVIGGEINESLGLCAQKTIATGFYAVFEFYINNFNVFSIVQLIYLNFVMELKVQRGRGDDIIIAGGNGINSKEIKITYLIPLYVS